MTGLALSDSAVSGASSYSYRVRARDASGKTGGYSGVATALTPAAPPFSLRVNAGGGAYVDSAGQSWVADTGFNTASAAVYPSTTAIAGTNDPALYRSERWDPGSAPELTYAFTVPNGSYQVRLHFAENYSGAFGVGRRVFDVQVEGALAIDDLDIYAAAGARAALVRTVTATVRNTGSATMPQ